MASRLGLRQAGLGVRWTIGDVTPEGFEALQLSICGAWRIFGPAASYLVSVNSIGLEVARQRTGFLPVVVEWRSVSAEDVPDFLRLDPAMAEGVGWKFCPLRTCPDRHELALDNDCILWNLPPAVERWLASMERCLIAEDVRPHLGQFDQACGSLARNSGMRGLPPAYPFEQTLQALVRDRPPLTSEGDEQGLQVAAVSACGPPEVVPLRDVAICSPFPPHLPGFGRCGVHLVGLNTKTFDWKWYGRNPREVTREHWQKLKPAIEQMVLK